MISELYGETRESRYDINQRIHLNYKSKVDNSE